MADLKNSTPDEPSLPAAAAAAKRNTDLDCLDQDNVCKKKQKSEISTPFQEDDECKKQDESSDDEEDDGVVDEEEVPSNGKSVVDKKGKGIMTEDKGKGKLKVDDEESNDDDDDDGDSVDDGVEHSDDDRNSDSKGFFFIRCSYWAYCVPCDYFYEFNSYSRFMADACGLDLLLYSKNHEVWCTCEILVVSKSAHTIIAMAIVWSHWEFAYGFRVWFLLAGDGNV